MDNEEIRAKLMAKLKEFRECEHLFVKLRAGRWVGGFHSSDYEYDPTIVYCVKCGLNNINLDTMSENKRHKFYSMINYYNQPKYLLFKLNDSEFRKQIGKLRTHDAEKKLKLMSEEAFWFEYPKDLYTYIKTKYGENSNQDTFNLMKENDEEFEKEYRTQRVLDTISKMEEPSPRPVKRTKKHGSIK